MGKLIKALFLLGLGVCIGRASVTTDKVVKVETSVVQVKPTPTTEKVTEAEKVEEVEPVVEETLVIVEEDAEVEVKLGHKNAYNRAKKLVDDDAQSRKVVYEDLLKNGFSEEEAKYAVDDCDIDWNNSCYREGKYKLKYNNYSKKQLDEYLQGKGFKKSEITYALDKLGY